VGPGLPTQALTVEWSAFSSLHRRAAAEVTTITQPPRRDLLINHMAHTVNSNNYPLACTWY